MKYRTARTGRRADRALVALCQRELFAAARGHWHGSRIALRKAVRQWLRAHRGDRTQLRWVLRRVRANSAFAVALLALSAAPAHAQQDPFFTPIPPLGGLDVGGDSTASLGDLDGDGDLDLVSGETGGEFFYFENIGAANNPVFEALGSGPNSPFDGLSANSFSKPTLVDLDGDGDLDLVSGEASGAFLYFKNIGDANNPDFAAAPGVDNPLDGFTTGNDSAPTFGDLDGDGDLDLISGARDGTFFYFRNIGAADNPAFVAVTGGANPMAGYDVGGYSMPTLGDVDNDGDLDLFSGETGGTFLAYENTGTINIPAFVEASGVDNPLDGFDVGKYSSPTFGDLDDDGDLDVISGHGAGAFTTFANDSDSGGGLAFEEVVNPFAGFDLVSLSSPTLSDLDGDADLDLVAGAQDGTFFYFENTGDADTPIFLAVTGAANPLDGFTAAAGFSTPELGDLDDDGDLDLITGNYGGTFQYFANTGTANNPIFTELTGAANPFDGLVATNGFSTPALGDLDDDGDLDLITGNFDGTFQYFANIGTANNPAFIEETGANNPLDGPSIGIATAPAFSDIDRDGDLDVAAGKFFGVLFTYENTGTASNPAFAQLTGSANPLDGFDVGSNSAPAFGDIDNDGAHDLVVGESTGTFAYFAAPEPGSALLGAAGLGTLGWLARRRRESRKY